MWPLPPRLNLYEQVMLSNAQAQINTVLHELGSNHQKNIRSRFMLIKILLLMDPQLQWITNQLQSFIANHDLHNSFVTIALAAPLGSEQLVRLHKATPAINDFQLYPDIKKNDLGLSLSPYAG